MRRLQRRLKAIALGMVFAGGCSDEPSPAQTAGAGGAGGVAAASSAGGVADGGGGSGGGGQGGAGGGGGADTTRTVVLLQTSDLHANLYGWDYAAAAPDSSRGLLKVAARVLVERAATECTLLVDTGDTIQGTALGHFVATKDTSGVHPVAMAMNALGYAAMALGNHEFNFGLEPLARFVSDAKFPVLGANVREQDGSEAFAPYVVAEVCGVRVGVLGLVTQLTATWAFSALASGLRVDPLVDTAKAYVPKMRKAGAEVIVVAAHSGPERQPADSASPESWLTDPSTWIPRGDGPGVNDALAIAEQVPDVDVVLSGHTHLTIPKALVNGVLLTQPGRWGSHLGKVTVDVAKENGAWKVVAKDATLLPTSSDQEDSELAKLVSPAHEKVLAYVAEPVATSAGQFPGGLAGRVTDGPLADLLNLAQADAAAKAGFPVDASLTAVVGQTSIPAGEVRRGDLYAVYPYDNQIAVLDVDGAALRDALEKTAGYFVQIDPKALPANPAGVRSGMADFNYDLYAGITYTLDATLPLGSRVTSLKLGGVDVQPDQVVRVAMNGYRALGGGGYAMFPAATVVWQSAEEVIDVLSAYVEVSGALDPAATNACDYTLLPDLYSVYFEQQLGKAKCSP